MKLVRDILGLVAIVLLGLGYLGSQWAYFGGDPSRFAAAMDQASIRILATVLLVGAIGLSFVREGEAS